MAIKSDNKTKELICHDITLITTKMTNKTIYSYLKKP